jgi:hypothetical protein
MEHLPYIDEHRTRIAASPENVWAALLSLLRAQSAVVPTPLVRLWGLTPSTRAGEWSGTVRPGDTIPGFEVAEVDVARRLTLRGRHRFSRYALVFELERQAVDACTLRAETWATFPGLAGAGYRALVIGSGGHRFAVRRLLHSVAGRA